MENIFEILCNQLRKNGNFCNGEVKKYQSGVTLLLAILVLSAMMAISFSLATILFIEVRTSGDLIKTEPALYAASGVAEEAIFNVKRNVCPGGCNYTNQFTNNVSLPNAPIQTSTSTPVLQDRVAPGTSFTSANTYALYNAASGSSVSGSNYGRITLTYLDTGNTDSLQVYLCEFDPNEGVDPTGSTANAYETTACSNPTTVTHGGDSYWKLPNSNNFSMTPDLNSTHTWDIDPTKQQQLILFNPTNGGNNIYFKIETFGPSPTYVPTGLPYAGQTAVDISTANGAVGRKLRVIVPISAGAVAANPNDTVWVEDSLPTGAAINSDGGDSWTWVSANPAPFTGSLASQSNLAAGEHQHYFSGVTGSNTLHVNVGDVMVAYIWLDPINTPTEIMLQWHDGTGWDHRAYWGADSLFTSSTRFRVSSSLPQTGTWVRLTVPASSVNLEGVNVAGMAFTLYDGTATWDHAGKNP